METEGGTFSTSLTTNLESDLEIEALNQLQPDRLARDLLTTNLVETFRPKALALN